MSTLPMYVWAMVLVGLIGTTATICVMLWHGALTAGLGRGTATRVSSAVVICWGTWVLASVLLADADIYRFEPTRPVPWLPVGMVGALAAALLFARIPVVSRILAQLDGLWRLTVPQIFRVVGATFLVVMALGQLPAVFALPAGLGDIAIGVEAVFVACNLRRGVVGQQAVWFNILGLVDLVVALGIGFAAAPNAIRLLLVSPSTQAVSLLPVVLIPTTVVPLAAALHLASLRTLRAVRETAPIATPSGSAK
ncbi:MAG TPA: hypothetical protein VLZ05_23355 [Mycobacterium sp.]|nr:hypothetical protein [Mycobacterium sp.]HUH71558.1 hypothetical protein [Mycobacterium sp.]